MQPRCWSAMDIFAKGRAVAARPAQTAAGQASQDLGAGARLLPACSPPIRSGLKRCQSRGADPKDSWARKSAANIADSQVATAASGGLREQGVEDNDAI